MDGTKITKGGLGGNTLLNIVEFLRKLPPLLFLIAGLASAFGIGLVRGEYCERQRVEAIPVPEARIVAAVAAFARKKPLYVSVTKSDGSTAAVLSPSAEQLGLLDAIIHDEKHKIRVTLPCGVSA